MTIYESWNWDKVDFWNALKDCEGIRLLNILQLRRLEGSGIVQIIC